MIATIFTRFTNTLRSLKTSVYTVLIKIGCKLGYHRFEKFGDPYPKPGFHEWYYPHWRWQEIKCAHCGKIEEVLAGGI